MTILGIFKNEKRKVLFADSIVGTAVKNQLRVEDKITKIAAGQYFTIVGNEEIRFATEMIVKWNERRKNVINLNDPDTIDKIVKASNHLRDAYKKNATPTPQLKDSKLIYSSFDSTKVWTFSADGDRFKDEIPSPAEIKMDENHHHIWYGSEEDQLQYTMPLSDHMKTKKEITDIVERYNRNRKKMGKSYLGYSLEGFSSVVIFELESGEDFDIGPFETVSESIYYSICGLNNPNTRPLPKWLEF